MQTKTFRFLILSLLALSVLGGGVGSYFWFFERGEEAIAYQTPEEADSYVRFDMEAYDIIKEHYWQSASDGDLAGLFELSLEKASGEDATLATSTRSGVAGMLKVAFDKKETAEEKKELAVQTLIVALHNLAPQGRSGLLSQKEETALRDRVANINPNSNLYQALDIKEGASQAAVEEAFQKKKEELSEDGSPEAKEKLAQAKYAQEVLSDETTKKNYDEQKIEPTVFTRIYGSDTLYANFIKISPTTLQEFVSDVVTETNEQKLAHLIVDFRGNEGGALDFARYFLGVFVGPNQYAADLFHQGEREAERTPEQIPVVAELKQFEEIVFLTDEHTQSTAELTAAIFKRFSLATVVGTKTKGWGTVENTYPIETEIAEGEKYSLYLVNSLTLRDDQQPIEGNGVIPHVSIEEKGWEMRLLEYLDSRSLRSAVAEALSKEPQK
ncbi:MAG: S41 family peptidase [Candidatus Paceibacterota bacterium]